MIRQDTSRQALNAPQASMAAGQKPMRQPYACSSVKADKNGILLSTRHEKRRPLIGAASFSPRDSRASLPV
jgi:hypothetical protein